MPIFSKMYCSPGKITIFLQLENKIHGARSKIESLKLSDEHYLINPGYKSKNMNNGTTRVPGSDCKER